jgi:hypothetical protein
LAAGQQRVAEHSPEHGERVLLGRDQADLELLAEPASAPGEPHGQAVGRRRAAIGEGRDHDVDDAPLDSADPWRGYLGPGRVPEANELSARDAADGLEGEPGRRDDGVSPEPGPADPDRTGFDRFDPGRNDLDPRELDPGPVLAGTGVTGGHGERAGQVL